MLIGPRLMMGANRKGGKFETIVPLRSGPATWTANTNYPATDLFQAFRNQWGREVPDEAELTFTFQAGNYMGVIAPVDSSHIPDPGFESVAGRIAGPIPATFYFGTIPNNVVPKKIIFNIIGNCYGTGGCPNHAGVSRSLDYRIDGGAVFSLANTQSFINLSKPLIIKGNGNLFSGGGAGQGARTSSGTTRASCYGGSGAGYPSYNIIQQPVNTILNAGSAGHSNARTSGSNYLWIRGGAGGLFGREGGRSSTGTAPVSQGYDINNVNNWVTSNIQDGTGGGAPIFDFGLSPTPLAHALYWGMLDLTEFTGKMQNLTKTAWSNTANHSITGIFTTGGKNLPNDIYSFW